MNTQILALKKVKSWTVPRMQHLLVSFDEIISKNWKPQLWIPPLMTLLSTVVCDQPEAKLIHDQLFHYFAIISDRQRKWDLNCRTWKLQQALSFGENSRIVPTVKYVSIVRSVSMFRFDMFCQSSLGQQKLSTSRTRIHRRVFWKKIEEMLCFLSGQRNFQIVWKIFEIILWKRLHNFKKNGCFLRDWGNNFSFFIISQFNIQSNCELFSEQQFSEFQLISVLNWFFVFNLIWLNKSDTELSFLCWFFPQFFSRLGWSCRTSSVSEKHQ